MKTVDSFLHSVRLRMNRNRAFRSLLWAVIAGSSVLLIVALIYVWQGYQVPRYWYGIAAGATALGALAGSIVRRATVAEASEFADGFFRLKDTIVSHRRFEREHKEGGFYDLQAGATIEAVRPLDAAKVPFEWPRKLAAAAGVLTMACGLTAFKSTDQAIIDRLTQEQRTNARMEEVKRALEEMIKELQKGADGDEEQRALNPDELKKYVEDLKSTKDLADAMRQLADLERKMDKAAKALDQKRDEQLMKKAGEELEKEEDPQARDLAKKLKNEQFKEAAKDVEKMKPTNEEGKKLSEKRKEAAKLKAAAKRMAAAARNQKNSQSKNSKEGNQNDQKTQTAQLSKAQDQDELSEELEQLEMEADEYDSELQDLENLEKLGKIDPSKLGKCEKCEGKLLGRLDKLGKNLAKMGMKRNAKLKLLGMCKKAGQCQGYMQGMCQSPFAMPGGLKPGDGTYETSRDQKDELKDNGQTTQLKGQKGQGPSLTKVEAADDGTGVSHRKGEAKERAFQKQFESFVQREDVPEDVKDGVKQYFEALHAAEPAKAGSSEAGK